MKTTDCLYWGKTKHMEKEKKNIIDLIRDWLYESDSRKENDPEEMTRDFQNGEYPVDYLLIVARPKTFMDAEKLSGHIRSGRAVIIRTEEMKTPDKQRLLDFLSGVAMAKDGTIARLYQDVFICTPKNVGIIEE